MATTTWIREMLQKSGVAFEERHHPETFVTYQVAEREHLPPAEVAKVVVVIAQGKPLALVLPADRKVDMKAIQCLAKTSKARLATEGEMQRLFPDCELGAVPPLRHGEAIELWMDPSLETPQREIVFQAGTHQDAIRMKYDDWFRLVRPRVEPFALPRSHWLHASAVDEEEEKYGKDDRWAAIH